MSVIYEEIAVEVDVSKVNTGLGCAIDIGGSMCKAAFVAKDNSGARTLKCVAFPKNKLEEGVQYIANNIEKDASCQKMYKSGVAVRGPVKETIEKCFSASVTNLNEAEACWLGARYLLNNLPSKYAVHEFTEEEDKIVMSLTDDCIKFGNGFGIRSGNEKLLNWPTKKFPGATDPLSKVLDDPYPYLLLSAGTGCFYVNVFEDSFKHNGGTSRGGKFFLGLCQLLLGTSNYDEVIALAEKGEDSKLSNYMRELKSNSDNDDYALFPNDFLIFCFGKPVDEKKSLSEYKKEDIARALVSMIATELAHIFYLLCKENKCKNVILTGGLYKHRLVRAETAKAFATLTVTQGLDIGFYFIKHGMYANAIGALIKNATE